MASPAEDPPFDFLETDEIKLQDNRTVTERSNPLRFVPVPLGHEAGRKWIELQPDAMLSAARKCAEASAQNLADGKVSGSAKALTR